MIGRRGVLVGGCIQCWRLSRTHGEDVEVARAILMARQIVVLPRPYPLTPHIVFSCSGFLMGVAGLLVLLGAGEGLVG